jgi:hypothetical protein
MTTEMVLIHLAVILVLVLMIIPYIVYINDKKLDTEYKEYVDHFNFDNHVKLDKTVESILNNAIKKEEQK